MVIINKSDVMLKVDEEILKPGEKTKIKGKRFGKTYIYSKIGVCTLSFSYGKVEIDTQGRLNVRKKLFGTIVVTNN